jgi:hypothetical protein
VLRTTRDARAKETFIPGNSSARSEPEKLSTARHDHDTHNAEPTRALQASIRSAALVRRGNNSNYNNTNTNTRTWVCPCNPCRAWDGTCVASGGVLVVTGCTQRWFCICIPAAQGRDRCVVIWGQSMHSLCMHVSMLLYSAKRGGAGQQGPAGAKQRHGVCGGSQANATSGGMSSSFHMSARAANVREPNPNSHSRLSVCQIPRDGLLADSRRDAASRALGPQPPSHLFLSLSPSHLIPPDSLDFLSVYPWDPTQSTNAHCRRPLPLTPVRKLEIPPPSLAASTRLRELRRAPLWTPPWANPLSSPEPTADRSLLVSHVLVEQSRRD